MQSGKAKRVIVTDTAREAEERRTVVMKTTLNCIMATGGVASK